MNKKKENIKLTIEQAYDAAIDYLEKYSVCTSSEDIAFLASDMLLLVDETSADPAAQEDWDDSIRNILKKQNITYKENIKLNNQQAYLTVIDYLEGYYERTTSEDIANLISKMKLLEENTSANPTTWENWNRSVEEVLKRKKKDRPYLQWIKEF